MVGKDYVIAVDFDGTCVTNEHPKVGKNIGAGPVLRELVKRGYKIVLNTMRSDKDGLLKDAVKWFEKEGIELYGINENPTQSGWTSSPKVYAQLYIDDHGIGCPLKRGFGKSFVDWEAIIYYFVGYEPIAHLVATQVKKELLGSGLC